jgi:hypothetical protein
VHDCTCARIARLAGCTSVVDGRCTACCVVALVRERVRCTPTSNSNAADGDSGSTAFSVPRSCAHLVVSQQ